ncbi:MAG TPA: hypothetical protein DEG74_01865 [Clostridiales bacterium]|nr:hypothetical protein [Clostridiales bacterium]
MTVLAHKGDETAFFWYNNAELLFEGEKERVDYLEGLLLGRLWSDTDFENRRHLSLFLLYGVFVDLLVVYNYMTGGLNGLITGGFLQKVIIFVVLFFFCPALCFSYYRMPLWGKIPVLGAQLVKVGALTLMITAWARPKLTVSSGDLKDFFISYLNKTLEQFTAKYVDTAGTFATVLGVISGGVYVVVVILLIILAAVLIPGIVFCVARFLQYWYDKVVSMLVLSDYTDK